MAKLNQFLSLAGFGVTTIFGVPHAAAQQSAPPAVANQTIVRALAGDFVEVPAGSFEMGDVAALGTVLEKSDYRTTVEKAKGNGNGNGNVDARNLHRPRYNYLIFNNYTSSPSWGLYITY